jgi:hypothetical protein
MRNKSQHVTFGRITEKLREKMRAARDRLHVELRGQRQWIDLDEMENDFVSREIARDARRDGA